MMRRVLRWLRAPISLSAICLFSLNGLSAQGNLPSSVPLLGESDFIKWALTQGGLVIVLIIVGWSYRRDLVTLIRQEQERTRVLTDLIHDSTVALTQLADRVANCPVRER